MLRINNLHGLNTRRRKKTCEVHISAATRDLDLYTFMTTTKFNPAKPLDIILYIDPGVAVGSSSTATYGFTISDAFPEKTTITITNNGYIVGAGGNGGGQYNGLPGGPAMLIQRPVIFTNNGIIGGGGGGGSSALTYDSPGYGFGGGGGAGFLPGSGGNAGGGNSWPGYTGSLLIGGMNPTQGVGGPCSGGNLGQPGVSNGIYGKHGNTNWGPGVAGAAIVGNSHVTWLKTGDIRGSIS